MNKRRMLLLAFVALAAFASGGCGYNTLVEKQQNVRRSWSDVESNLQRRADLVPNLVAAAQSAGVQEQEVFGQIAQARSRLLNAESAPPQGEGGDKTPEQKQAVIDAANSFGGTIGRLLSCKESRRPIVPPELLAASMTPEQKQAVIDAANSFGGTIGRPLSLPESYRHPCGPAEAVGRVNDARAEAGRD